MSTTPIYSITIRTEIIIIIMRTFVQRRMCTKAKILGAYEPAAHMPAHKLLNKKLSHRLHDSEKRDREVRWYGRPKIDAIKAVFSRQNLTTERKVTVIGLCGRCNFLTGMYMKCNDVQVYARTQSNDQESYVIRLQLLGPVLLSAAISSVLIFSGGSQTSVFKSVIIRTKNII
jgi:hypothetical protein